QVGDQSHADRYAYLPQIGLVMAITWLVEDISLAVRNRTAILSAAVGVIVVSLMGLGWKQTMVWRDSRSLWMHALSVNPRNDTAHNALAAVALREESGRRGHIPCPDQWQKTLELDAANLNAQVNLAWTLATFPYSTIRNGAKAV